MASSGILLSPSNPPETGDNLIDTVLPKELLLRVYSFLDTVSLCRAAQVSKYWNQLALDGQNWSCVNLFDFQVDITSSVIQRLSSRTGGFLNTLCLKGCRTVTDDSLSMLAQSCPNLAVLNLEDCVKLTDWTCVSIAKFCPNIVNLNLTGLKITDTSLNALSTSLQLTSRLQHLNVNFCDQLTADGLIALLTSSTPDTITTNIGTINGTSTNGSGDQNQVTNNQQQHNNQNQEPYVNGGTTGNGWNNSNGNTNHSSQHTIPNHRNYRNSITMKKPFSSLKTFSAKLAPNLITNESLIALVTNAATNLRSLVLTGCTNVTDTGVIAIGSNCPNLIILTLTQCNQITDVSLHALAAGLPNLSTLEVASCTSLTDAGLSSLARGCTRLTRLDLEEVTQLTDSTLIALASSCPQLQILMLSHCELITDNGIGALAQNAEHSRLKVLELDNCPLISDATLNRIHSLVTLERLELYDCQLITRPGIRRLKLSLPAIRVHAYFAPTTPPLPHEEGMEGAGGLLGPGAGGVLPGGERPICKCCIII